MYSSNKNARGTSEFTILKYFTTGSKFTILTEMKLIFKKPNGIFHHLNFSSDSKKHQKLPNNMPSLKSHRIKRGLMKLVPKWKNEQAGKSFYLFMIGATFMLSSFSAPFWIM